jgi:hypothetical protein
MKRPWDKDESVCGSLKIHDKQNSEFTTDTDLKSSLGVLLKSAQWWISRHLFTVAHPSNWQQYLRTEVTPVICGGNGNRIWRNPNLFYEMILTHYG